MALVARAIRCVPLLPAVPCCARAAPAAPLRAAAPRAARPGLPSTTPPALPAACPCPAPLETRSGVFNDLGSGSNVDLCVISKEGVEYKRGYEVLQVGGWMSGGAGVQGRAAGARGRQGMPAACQPAGPATRPSAALHTPAPTLHTHPQAKTYERQFPQKFATGSVREWRRGSAAIAPPASLAALPPNPAPSPPPPLQPWCGSGSTTSGGRSLWWRGSRWRWRDRIGVCCAG